MVSQCTGTHAQVTLHQNITVPSCSINMDNGEPVYTHAHTGEHHSSDLQYKSSVQMKCETNKQTNKQTRISASKCWYQIRQNFTNGNCENRKYVVQLRSNRHHYMFHRLTQKHLRLRYGNKTNGRTGGVPPTSRLALAVRNQGFECTYITLGLKKLESFLRCFTA